MGPVFCSWSGGKDSALALHEATRAGAEPRRLLTMLTEGGERSRSHGLRRALLEAQAAALGVPIAFGAASWDGYRPAFVALVRAAVAAGAPAGVFGDIDVEDHREWERAVCAEAGATACLPLWGRERAAVVEAAIEHGFRALIVAVRDGVLPTELLGRELDAAALRELERAGVDLAGEAGEYHTVVVDGPPFRHPLEVAVGERVLRDGVWFADVVPR
jgi:uncharacterized protein (TIGR00290 family)